MTSYHQPMTGAGVAVLAWSLEPTILDMLLAAKPSNEQDYQDVRAQLALWATTQSAVEFDSFPAAWNAFVTPPNVPGPVVLLPGSQCTNPECRKRRFNVNDLGRAGVATCSQCMGTGRKPPRAFPAALADASLGMMPATGTDNS